MMMLILSSASAGARPALAASVLKKAKAVADFNNFANFIFILPVPLPTHQRQRKTTVVVNRISRAPAPRNRHLERVHRNSRRGCSLGRARPSLRRQISEHVVRQRLVPADFGCQLLV